MKRMTLAQIEEAVTAIRLGSFEDIDITELKSEIRYVMRTCESPATFARMQSAWILVNSVAR